MKEDIAQPVHDEESVAGVPIRGVVVVGCPLVLFEAGMAVSGILWAYNLTR